MVGFLRSLKPGQVAVVPPVVAEVEYGIQRLTPGNRQSLAGPPARATAVHDDFDIAIAAIAVAHGAQLITANLAHFRRIEDLTCRHWAR